MLKNIFNNKQSKQQYQKNLLLTIDIVYATMLVALAIINATINIGMFIGTSTILWGVSVLCIIALLFIIPFNHYIKKNYIKNTTTK